MGLAVQALAGRSSWVRWAAKAPAATILHFLGALLTLAFSVLWDQVRCWAQGRVCLHLLSCFECAAVSAGCREGFNTAGYRYRTCTVPVCLCQATCRLSLFDGALAYVSTCCHAQVPYSGFGVMARVVLTIACSRVLRMVCLGAWLWLMVAALTSLYCLALPAPYACPWPQGCSLIPWLSEVSEGTAARLC